MRSHLKSPDFFPLVRLLSSPGSNSRVPDTGLQGLPKPPQRNSFHWSERDSNPDHNIQSPTFYQIRYMPFPNQTFIYGVFLGHFWLLFGTNTELSSFMPSIHLKCGLQCRERKIQYWHTISLAIVQTLWIDNFSMLLTIAHNAMELF